MDMMTGLRYFSDHIEHVIGGLVVLFLLTSILLLIRNINQRDGQKEHAAGDSGRGAGADLDVGAVEAAMMRVLAAQGVGTLAAVAAGAKTSTHESAKAPAVGSGEASGDAVQLQQELQERDTKLQELAREIDRLNAEVATQKSAPGGEAGAGGGGDSELQSKIEELQARLSEYEIIEDDIADLSLFKEENAQLKAELERLRNQAPVAAASEAPVAPVAAPAAEAEAPVDLDSLSALVEEAEVIAAKEPVADPDANPAQAAIDALLAGATDASPVTEPSTPVSAPAATDAAKVVSQEDIDKLFALAPSDTKAAPSVATAPAPATEEELDAEADSFVQVDLKETETVEDSPAPRAEEDATKLAATADELSAIMLDSTLDTEKMLSEVEALSDTGDGEDVLAGSLDTEKLLAEMNTIDEDKKPAAPAAPQTSPAPAPVLIEDEEPAGEDDLLAEFKDPTDGGQR